MDQEKTNQTTTEPAALATEDRREAAKKLGKFAAYAAPFTLLAFANKANAASGGGPVKGRH